MAIPAMSDSDPRLQLLSPRFIGTVITAVAVLALDALTPLGLTISLLQVLLIWITSLWANPRQIVLIGALCLVFTVLGFWWSPRDGTESWVAAGNLLLSVGAVLAIANTGWRRSTAEQDRLRAAEELVRSQAEIKVLTGLLPICASCKKIRDDSGNWETIETYITRHSEA